MRTYLLAAVLWLAACSPITKAGLFEGDESDPVALAAAANFESWCRKSDLTSAEKATISLVMQEMETSDCDEAGRFLSEEEELDLSSRAIDDVGPLLGFKNLTGLYLSESQLGQSQADRLVALSNLENLDLSYNHLTAIPALPANLKKLDLSANEIETWGAGFSRTPHLTHVSLRENNLGALGDLPLDLEFLDVGENPLENDASTMTALNATSRLQGIFLTNQASAQQLKLLLPKAKVVTDRPLVIFSRRAKKRGLNDPFTGNAVFISR